MPPFLPPSPAQLEEGCPQMRVRHNSERSLWFLQKKWVIISLVSKICQIETRKIQRKWLYRSSQTKTRQNDLCWKSTCFLQSTYSHIHIYVYDYIDIRHVYVYMCVFVYKLRQKHGCTSCKLQIQSLIQICSRQRHLAHIRKIN